MAKASEARTIVSIFQQDRRTYQNLSARPDTTAKGLCDRAISQFDLVQLSRRELVRDGRSFGLFHLPASGGEMPVPDNENLLDFMRRCGEQKPKFAFLMRDTRDFLFLKEKHVSIDAAIPPSPKAVTPAKDAQGWLRKKKEGKQWKKRWVKLVGTNLQYQKDPRDREPLGSLPLTECSLSFKVLSGLRTIIIARFDKAKPNARPTVFLFCADKESTGLSVDEWYASIYARINPISGSNTMPKSLSSSASAPALLASPPPIAASPPASSGTIYLNSTAKKEGVNLTMRERAMCCWINTLCARKKIPVASIGSELDNGIVLMAISELGFKQRITARYATDITAMTWEQKLSNLAIAMDALRTAGARFSPIAPQVFIDGHKALIMQFIWEVIVSFHIRGATANIKDAMNEDSFRRQLLEKTQFYIGITQDAQVTNFTSSFADGFAFCYIVERFKPGVIDFREIVKEKPRENLKAAFAVAANAGMPPCISPYEFGDGVDELAVVIWLCMWFDLMDAARKAFFEPLPVVPVSQRVLMDKLMDGKDNPREIMAVMREISQNEKNRKVYQTQKEMNNAEAERLKREELARLRQETEAERMSNLQAIVSAVTNKDKDKEEEEREPEVDEEENFRRQQMIIKAQYEKYQAVQQRLLESTRGSSKGGELTPAPTAAPAATFAPSNLQDDSLERRMIEEFGSDEEIYDVTAELQNLDSMLGDLETTANTASPAGKRESEARREVDDLFAWEDDPSSSNNSSAKSSARIDKKTLDPKRSTVDRVIDEQIRAIEAIRLKEQSGPSLLSSPPARNSSGEQAQRERRSTATKAELESTVNEVEAFLTALTARRASNVSANQAKAAALAAAAAMQQPPPQHSPYISLSSPSTPSLSTAPSSSYSATATYSQLPSSSYSTPSTTSSFGPPPSSTTFTPPSIAPPPTASAPPMNPTVAALSASSPRKNSNPFEDDDEAAILPSKPKPAALTKSIDMPVGIFHLKNSTADINLAVPASPPPAATSLSSYPAPVPSSPPPVPLFSAPSPPRSPPYEPPVVPPPLPPFVSMLSPLRDAPPPPQPPLSPRALEPSSPRDYPKIHPPPAPAFSVPPLADMEPPPPLPAPPAPIFTAPPLAASTPPTASMKASLAALAAFEDSFAAFDLEEPKSRALLVQSGPATAPPSTITVPPPPTAAAPPPPSSSSSTTTSTSSKRDDFGDLDAQFAALTASLNSLAADATFATRPKVAATLPSNPTPPPTAPAVNVVPSSPQPRSASPSLPANASNPLQPPRSVSPAREKGGVAAMAAAFAARNEAVNSSTPQSIPSPREREVTVSASILALSFSSSSSSSSPATFSPPAPQSSSKPASSALSSSLSVLPSVSLSPASTSTTLSAPSSAPPLSTSQPIPARSLAPSAASFSSAAVPPSRSFSPSPTSATPPNAFYGRRAGDSPPKSPNPGGPLLHSGSSSTSSPSPSPSSTNPWMAKINAMPGKINSPFFKNKAEAKPADGAAKNEPQKSPIRAGIVAANNNPNNNGGGGPTSPRSPRSVSPSSATAPKDEPQRTVKPAAFKAKPMPVVMAPSGGAADLLFGDDTPSGGAPFALKKDNDLDKAMADLLS